MDEINRVGICKDANAIIDVLEEVKADLNGMSGALNYNASSHGMAVKTLKAIAQEVFWLAIEVAVLSRNGAFYTTTYRVMGTYEHEIDCLYDVMEDIQGDEWRDEIYDNIKKLTGLHAPMIRVMENAVIKNWQISEADKARAEREKLERESFP